MLEPSKKISMDGSFVDWNKANVHILTYSLHYGYAIFEGIRYYETPKGPAIFRLDDHLERLFFSANAAKIKIPYSKQQLRKAVIRLVRTNKLPAGYIRPLVYLAGDMGLNPKNNKVHTAIATWKWGAYLGKAIERGAKTIIAKQRRPDKLGMPINAKVSGNYASSALAKMEALEKQVDESIMLDKNGNVAECTGENIFIVKNKVLITPPLDYILAGITRRSIIEIAKDTGIKVKEKFFTPSELLKADEIFITGTAAEVTPVVIVNGKKIGNGKPGSMTKFLQRGFFAVVHGRHPRYRKWLTYV